jgi:hypothetical protein
MFDESFFDQLRALPTRKLIRKTIHDGLLSFASYATVLRIDAARLEKYMDGDDMPSHTKMQPNYQIFPWDYEDASKPSARTR